MRPGPPGPAPAPELETDPEPGPYARVTVLAPHRRVDVALPADVPVGELVPMVLELVGDAAPGYLPWRLTGATGGPLHPAATLDELGVLDGELLRIGPDTAPPAPPVFDDPVDALASTAGRRAGVPGRGPAAVSALVLTVAAAALLVTVPVGGPGGWAASAAVIGFLGAAGALARAAALVRRVSTEGTDHPSAEAAADRGAAGVAAMVSIPLAAAAGAVALTGFSVGAQLLSAAAAAGVAAAAGQVVLRVVEPVLVAVVVAAVPVGVAAVLHLRLGVTPGALAAGAGALALVAGPLIPRAALRLAGLPLPVVPADASELTDADDGADPLPPAELAERADLARGYLAGLVGGTAVLAGAAALPTAATGGWIGPMLAVVIVVVLGLRARGFADPAPGRTLVVVALVAGLGLAGLAGSASGPAGRLLVAALLVLGACAVVVAGQARPAPSPVARRAVDLLEGVLVAVAVPLALGAMGLYALVRAL